MSQTEMYAFDYADRGWRFAEFHNSHRGAMWVWRWMMMRHFHAPKDAVGMLLLKPDLMQGIWDLWKNRLIPIQHRVALLTTFDHCLVHRSNLLFVAECLDAVGEESAEEVPSEMFPGCVRLEQSHLPSQATYLRKASTESRIRHVGWRQSSVSECLWDVSTCNDAHSVYSCRNPNAWEIMAELRRIDAE